MKRKYSIYAIGIGGMLGIASVFAQNTPPESFFYQTSDTNTQKIVIDPSTEKIENTTNIAQGIKENSISDQNSIAKKESILYKIRQYFRLTGTTYDNSTPAISYIKMIINLLLGLVSFISLILVIFAFYLIFFEKGEEGVKKAKKILTGVAIAIVIM